MPIDHLLVDILIFIVDSFQKQANREGMYYFLFSYVLL